MLALKLILLFAVASTHVANGIADPRDRNLLERLSIGMSVKKLRWSSSGRFEEIPNEVSNYGSDERNPHPQESLEMKNTESEISSTGQEADITLTTAESSPTKTEASSVTTEASPTTTEASPTTTEASPTTTVKLTTVPLPEVCASEFETYWVSDFSEAEKQFLIRFTGLDMEQCCQKVYFGSAELWEYSISMEDEVCTIYRYAPHNRSEIGPPPKKDGNDKILNVRKSPPHICSFDYHGRTMYTSRNGGGTTLPEPNKTYCSDYGCYGTYQNSIRSYNFGDKKCISTLTGSSAKRLAADIFLEVRGVFTLFSDSEEQIFDSHDWSEQFEDSDVDHLDVDVEYDSALNEYRWRQSLRPIPDNSSLWALHHPSSSRHPCVAVYLDGLKDVECGNHFRYLGVVYVSLA